MANERIISGGIITPKVVFGTQSASGTLNFDSSTNSIIVNANLKIIGDLNQVTTTNSQLHDNLILLNAGQTGNGISAGTSGIEIDRGTGSRIKFVLVENGDLNSYWISTNFEGNGIAIRSAVAPSNSQDLTNKNYVDSVVSNAALTLLGSLSIDSLNDVTITGQPSNGQILQYSNGQWRNVSLSGSVTSVAVNSPNSSISVSGSPITTSGTISIDLPNQSVTSGTYYNSVISVNNKGIITGISDNNMFQTVRLNSSNGGSSNGVTSVPIVWNDYLLFTAGQGMDVSSYDPGPGPGAGITFALQNSGVSAGVYSNPTITVDSTGRITSASTGSGGGISIAVPSGTNISNKNSISFNSSNSTLAINGTSATNISFGLPALHGGGNFRGRSSYFQFDQYGRLTAVSGDPVTTANFGSVSTDSGTYGAPGDSANFSIVGKPGSGITTEISGSQVLIGRSGSAYDIPRYQVWTAIGYTTNSASFIKQYSSGFGGMVSFGDIYFASSNDVAYQSKLYEMKLNVSTATTIYGFVAWSDDWPSFFLNGSLIAGSTGSAGGQKNLTVTWNLVAGLNTVQVICVNSGGHTMDMNYLCNFFDGNSAVTYAGP